MRVHFRNKLSKLLGAAVDEEFVQLLWAVNALQSDYANAAKKFIQVETIPPGAITTDMSSKLYIQKWEIETLVNELMTTPKRNLVKNGRVRRLNWSNFQAAIECINCLRKLENAEHKFQKNNEDILIEMGRIAARQFDWQTGYGNVPQFYRNAWVYGQNECATYFEITHGISFNRFSQIGFMLYVLFTDSPVFQDEKLLNSFGVKSEEVEKVLALIGMPFNQAAKSARMNRKVIIHTADKPSILRQAPILRFGIDGARIRAPLLELILERITSGVFYDVVGGSGVVRNDYGKRFEEYCFRYLSVTLPGFTWEQEFSYRKRANTVDTPDIICNDAGKVAIAIECKATRMSQEAMFGKNPLVARGYRDLTKAVFQLWRFFSHCRLGFVKRDIVEIPVGIVLTLDKWLILAEPLRKRVLEDAVEMAQNKAPEIAEEDRKPIIFVTVAELERLLSVATEETLKASISNAISEKYLGWRLDGVHRDLFKDRKLEMRKYPFANELGTLLPWWDELDKIRR